MKKLVFVLAVSALGLSCTPSSSAKEQAENIEVNSVETVESEVIVKEDSVRVEDLSAYFVEEGKAGYKEVQAKSVSQTGNGVYCYFRLKGKKASNMRLHIQYWDDAYADVDYYKFVVDGTTYNYTANRDKNVVGNVASVQSSTFFWYDNNINKTDQKFLEALSESESASLSLIDRGTNTVVGTIVISEQVKKDIRRTLDYYFSLDGSLIPRAGMVNIRD